MLYPLSCQTDVDANVVLVSVFANRLDERYSAHAVDQYTLLPPPSVHDVRAPAIVSTSLVT